MGPFITVCVYCVYSSILYYIRGYILNLQGDGYSPYVIKSNHSVQIVTNIIFVFIYASCGTDNLGVYTYDVMANVEFWFSLLIATSMCLIPIIISKTVYLLFAINITNNIRNKKFEDDYLRKTYIKKLENMTKCTRSLARFKKIYKADNDFVPTNYADKRMKELVELYKNLKNEKQKEEDIEYFNETLFRRSRSVDLRNMQSSKARMDRETLTTDRQNKKRMTFPSPEKKETLSIRNDNSVRNSSLRKEADIPNDKP
jgi:hypothetical protein